VLARLSGDFQEYFLSQCHIFVTEKKAGAAEGLQIR
jgi:hypothetical protein